MEKNNTKVSETSKITVEYDKNGCKILNGYKIIKKIGSGAYSKVKLSVHTQSQKEFAVKIINKSILEKRKKGLRRDKNGNTIVENLLQDALKEIEILKKLKHKNIINLLEIIHAEEFGKIYLITEYASKGPSIKVEDAKRKFLVNPKITKAEQYTEKQIKSFFKDIATAVMYIHSQNIVHRDIKPDNMLIDSENNLRLTDFNIATEIEEEDAFTKTEGNLYFYPPEFCNSKSKIFAAKPVDIWAIGVSMYILVFKNFPFEQKENLKNIIELMQIIEKAEIKFPKTRKISEGLTSLFLGLFEKDPAKRLTAADILSHPYLN